MGARKTIYVGMAASGRARGPLWVDLCSTQPDLQRTALSIQHRTVPGQEPTVEVALQFEQPWSGPPLLNGRFPASEFPVALPQRGHEPPFTCVVGWMFRRHVCSGTGHQPIENGLFFIGHSRCSVSNPIEGQLVTASGCHSMSSKRWYF